MYLSMIVIVLSSGLMRDGMKYDLRVVPILIYTEQRKAIEASAKTSKHQQILKQSE